MHVRKFNHSKDVSILKEWISKRDISTEFTDSIPELGFMVYEQDEKIAAGFIRLCEGGYGIIEGFTSNPNKSPSIRNEALDLLLNHMLLSSKSINLKILWGYTTDKNTKERSMRHGFVCLPHTIVCLDLSKAG